MVPLRSSSMYINKSMETTLRVQKVMHFISTSIKPDFVDKPEVHDFWEIVYLESGEAIVEADGTPINLLAGEAIFHKPGEAHSISAFNGTINVFFISFYSSSKVMSLFDGLKISLSSEQKKIIHKLYDEARNIFVQCSRPSDPGAFVSKALLPQTPLGAQQLYRLYLEELLLVCARAKGKSIKIYDSKEKYEKVIIERILDIMSECLYSSFSIDYLCSMLNYSKTYLSTVFKNHQGVSIMSFYNSLKIKEAKKLLGRNGYSVSETARILNYNNPYYFAKVFKKHEGIPPSEYRKNK